jgi:Uncharacterized protein conserved in bacteria
MHRRQWLALTLAAAAGSAAAQGYPTKVIKLQVPFAPGGTTDIIARVIADPLGRALGQSVIVENKSGGGGIVGANETAKSAPDGYTLGVANGVHHGGQSGHQPQNAVQPADRFHAHHQHCGHAQHHCGAPQLRSQDYKSFVAEVKKSPGKYSYASSGTGGIGHLQMELYKNLSGTS